MVIAAHLYKVHCTQSNRKDAIPAQEIETLLNMYAFKSRRNYLNGCESN